MATRIETDSGTRQHRLPRFPGQVVALVGVSTTGYALALAGIASLQAASDAAVVADRAPAAAGIDAVASGHDRLAGRLDDLAGRQARSAASYDAVTSGIARVEAELGALAGKVSAVDGASRTLPASVALPPVVRSVRPSSRSTTHATTGGSAAP